MAEQRHTARVSPPPHLNVKKGSAEWKLFKQMWDNYVIVARLDNEAADYKKTLFLHTLGPDGLLIYNGMKLGDNHTLEDIIEALENNFIGKTNETYERFVFNKRSKVKWAIWGLCRHSSNTDENLQL